MTTMDSDSESQDSDDGRRFRFEATRKDHIQPEMKLENVSRSKLEREYYYSDTECEGKKGRSKASDSDKGVYRLSKERDSGNRDLKHSAKYLKHSLETKNSKREDSRDYRNAKDVGSNSRSSPVYSKHKTRETKRYRSRDRDVYRRGRSQERSRNKNETEKSQSEKHRNKSRERRKHHSSDRNRDKNYQLNKTKSTDLCKLHGAPETCGAYKKTLVTKDDEGERLQECTLPKNTRQDQSNNDSSVKRDLSVDSQEYKELSLSEFDILSETDENVSDDADVKYESSLLQQRSQRAEKRNLDCEYENSSKKQVIEFEPLDGSPKVNARKNEKLYGSSNNNSGTISDSTLGTTSPILTESRKSLVDFGSEEGNLNTAENTSLHVHNHDSVKPADNVVPLSEMLVERNTTYGPSLPPQITISCFSNRGKDVHIIGPSLPSNDVQCINDDTEEDALNCIARNDVTSNEFASDTSTVFGPALPPHLLKQKCNNEKDNTILIGSAIPDTVNTFDNNVVDETESENEDAIGPLPANHPSLDSNYVYKQLEERAQQIKSKRKDEDCNMVNQRDEWMTELPPPEMNNAGLTSRKFRIRAGPDMSDRSCWTDTPAKRAEKQRRKEEEKLYNVVAPIHELPEDKDESESLESKKRGKSLLDMHQNKLRKKKRKEEKKAKESEQTVRRPFNRDIDLQISQFNQDQKNSIINRAQHLDDRFARGKY